MNYTAQSNLKIPCNLQIQSNLYQITYGIVSQN